MPYIKEADRTELLSRAPQTAGELNFAITTAVIAYVEQHGTNYAVLNEAVGVLECAKLELYRRMISAYEDKKIAENGDVYP